MKILHKGPGNLSVPTIPCEGFRKILSNFFEKAFETDLIVNDVP